VIPNIIFATLNIVFTVISGILVDNCGRKILYLIGTFSITIWLISTGIMYDNDAYLFEVISI